MIEIKNNRLSAGVALIGANLEYLSVDGKNVLWQKDKMWWNRTAPFLFPIVGRLLDDEYIHNGKTYSLNQHGFLRDSAFTVISQDQSQCSLLLQSNETTRKVYPFDFEVVLRYRVEEASIIIDADVKNVGKEPMFYSIGYHPAFVFEEPSVYFDLIGKDPMKEYLFDGSYCSGSTAVTCHQVQLDQLTHDNSTLVYGGVDEIIMHDGNRSLSVDLGNYPYVGIWRPMLEDGRGAPFVCIEPWTGFGDWVDHDKVLRHKFAIESISPQQSKRWTTAITF